MSAADKKDEMFFEPQEYEGTGKKRVNKNYCLKHALNNLFGTDWVTVDELIQISKELSQIFPNHDAKTSNWGSDDAIHYVNRAHMFDDQDDGTFLYRLRQIPPNVWALENDTARRRFFVNMFNELRTKYRGSSDGLGGNWFMGVLQNVDLNHWVCDKTAKATHDWNTYFFKDSMGKGIIPRSQRDLIGNLVDVAKRNHQIYVANQKNAFENICLLFCKSGMNPKQTVPKQVRNIFPLESFKQIKSNSTGSSSSGSSTGVTTISKVSPFRCVICNYTGHRVQHTGLYPHTDEAQTAFQAFLDNQLSQPL